MAFPRVILLARRGARVYSSLRRAMVQDNPTEGYNERV